MARAEISFPPCRGTGILKITVLLGNRPASRNLGLLGESHSAVQSTGNTPRGTDRTAVVPTT